MKFKVLIVFVFVVATLGIARAQTAKDSLPDNKPELLDPDALLEKHPDLAMNYGARNNKAASKRHWAAPDEDDEEEFKLPAYIPPVKIDTLLLENNPFFIDLVFTGFPEKLSFNEEPDFGKLYFGYKAVALESVNLIRMQPTTPLKTITTLRRDAREMLCREAVLLFTMFADELPDPESVKNHAISSKPLRNIRLIDDSKFETAATGRKFVMKDPQLNPWTKKAATQLQFSQNFASDNWYQGGSRTMSVLGILTGQLNYDNRKNVQWENSGEWRMGFYALFNDKTAVRDINVNDDILKVNSKLGLKAGENLFYSGTFDFSTQFLNSYKSPSSKTMKTSFLTPVRMNIGVGMDYKYKKAMSVMLAPVSYKYIYTNDTIHVSQNLFGISKGKNYLSEIGSSLTVQNNYSPFRELQLDSKFSFYTNYKKVEINWEIVANFTVNRFLSTRIALTPRYDNTVILASGEKAQLQFKELMSFGFSYKFFK